MIKDWLNLRYFVLTALVISSTLFKGYGQQSGVILSYPFMNPDLPVSTRVNDLVSKLTLEEKIQQMQHTAPAIDRLGIPQYNWWNECLHGVARNGIATVFPQAIGMAATFNPALIQKEADVISTEARAKYYEAISRNQHDIYQGLTFWSPNINIFRDPRWGRGQETYGEDPFLTSRIGIAFVKGLQGNDAKYFKVVATAKHFAVHSGPEPDRHKFDAWPTETDLYETYLPAFEALVKEAGVYSVMGAYNRVYGTPACASDLLLGKLLRDKWGFKGYVVSDCWAVSDFYNFHKFVNTPEKAASLAVKAGTDLSCGPEYGTLLAAIKSGYISESEIDISVKRLFEARFRLGMFDPPARVQYASISPDQYNTGSNRILAREVALQSIVLLKNQDHILPLTKKTKTIAVVGPYANDTSVLLGNYNGIPSQPVTLLEGLRRNAPKGTKLFYCRGVERPEILAKHASEVPLREDSLFKAAVSIARKSDVIIFSAGISPNLEGEEMDVKVEGFSSGDRTSLDLPASQLELLAALKSTGTPIIVILTNGSALAVNWAEENADAIIEAWYPGQEGGNAVAEVIWGKFNPAGRLPVTFYKSVNDLPAFDDYSMKGRTYRYFDGKPLYAFGYGLSYSSFSYKKLDIARESLTVNDTLLLKLTVTNDGMFDGDEVVQVYMKQPGSLTNQPVKSLIAFEREHFVKGESRTLEIVIPVARLRHYSLETNDYAVAKGNYQIMVGAASNDIRLNTTVTVR